MSLFLSFKVMVIPTKDNSSKKEHLWNIRLCINEYNSIDAP